MKVVYFGYNALSSCLDLLCHREDISIAAIYTGDVSAYTDQIHNLAESFDLLCHTNKPTLDAMLQWVDQGVECFICAEYPYKIPVPDNLPYSVNIHPTCLPEGRGQTPLPHLILDYPDAAGITLHQLTENFDAGDILLGQTLDISDDETFDSLHAKVFLQAPMLLQQLLDNLDTLFHQAKAQGKGSTWPTIKRTQQRIHWNMSQQEIERISRAFSSLGVAFTLNNTDYYYTSAQCVLFEHTYQAGDVISFDQFKLIIALRDGFIIIPRSCLYTL